MTTTTKLKKKVMKTFNIRGLLALFILLGCVFFVTTKADKQSVRKRATGQNASSLGGRSLVQGDGTLPGEYERLLKQINVDICHLDGEGNFHTINVAKNAVNAHLKHGDLEGSCLGQCPKACRHKPCFGDYWAVPKNGKDGCLCNPDGPYICDTAEVCFEDTCVEMPSAVPSQTPSAFPSLEPSTEPSSQPSVLPSVEPSSQPSVLPSAEPSTKPSSQPTVLPSAEPSTEPSSQPSVLPSGAPSSSPSANYLPSKSPTCSVDASLPALQTFSDSTSLKNALGHFIIDDYENAGYGFVQSSIAMSAVLAETDYVSTFHLDVNIVFGCGGTNHCYCSGCNGSHRFSFTSTSVSCGIGVYGVGFDVVWADSGIYAFVTYGDGTTQDFPLAATNKKFWGITASKLIKSVHVGLQGGGSTQLYSYMDNLIIGSP